MQGSKENDAVLSKTPFGQSKTSHNRSNTVPTIKFFERALKINQETVPFTNESLPDDQCLQKQNTILI